MGWHTQQWDKFAEEATVWEMWTKVLTIQALAKSIAIFKK